MTGDEATFLRAILANPGDDLPRLLFADWLDEYGHAGRAEYIRLECECRRTKSTDKKWFAADAKMRRLLARHSGPYDGATCVGDGLQWCSRVGGRLTRRLFELRGVATARVGFAAGAHPAPVQVNSFLVDCERLGGLPFGWQGCAFPVSVNYRRYDAYIVYNLAFGLPGGRIAFYLGETLIYAEA